MKKFRIIKFKTKPILELKKISKSFANRLVLNQVSFHVNRGEIFGILGPNGSGKTTLFNLILGILPTDSGKITINGETINSFPIHVRCENYKISYVPQNSACLLGLTVESNLEAISEIKIKDKIKRKEIIQELLARFALENIKHTKARSLSGGERRRLSISMALVTKPNILLLDEPFSALDPLSVETIRKIIADLQQQSGISSILSDHNISSILVSVDRAILISNSLVIAEGRPKELLNNKLCKKLYFGSELKI